MRCMNCHGEIPETAKVCEFCEAKVQPEPSPDAMQEIRESISQLPPEERELLNNVFHGSDTAEEFVNRMMIGDCPKCGSTETGDCDNDPEINDIMVARCYACGQFWCAECGEPLGQSRLACECWDDELE